MSEEPTQQERVEATMRRQSEATAKAEQEAAAAKAEVERARGEQASAPANEFDAETRQNAAAAGMTPERFSQLGGKTSLSDWEAGRA